MKETALDPKRYKKVQKQVAGLNLTDEQKKEFKKHINTALLLAHLSDTFMTRCEQTLRESGDWKLELKTLIKHAIGKLWLVTKYTDETLNRDWDNFYADIDFLDKLMLGVIKKATDDEKQSKILELIESLDDRVSVALRG